MGRDKARLVSHLMEDKYYTTEQKKAHYYKIMNVFSLSIKQLLAKPLTSLLSLLLLAFAVASISIMLILNKSIQEQFTNNIKGISMVVGAKGSPLQLILSSVYHIDAPTGNISYTEAKKLAKHPLIAQNIPLAYGDAHKGFRIVGTNEEFVKHYGLVLKEGVAFQKNYEVCIGATAAEKLGLKLGDTFFSAHGLQDDTHIHEDQSYKVVGIYEYANSVPDQLILSNIESVWAIHSHDEKPKSKKSKTKPVEDHNHEGHDHDHEGHDHDHEGHDHNHEGHDHDHDHEGHDHSDHSHEIAEEDQEITAMLVKFKSPMGMMQIPRMVNEQTAMMAALPSIEVNRIFSLLGVGVDGMKTIAYIIMLISGLSVFISLFNSLKEQKYELALMRTMGGTRTFLFIITVLQGIILSIIGFFIGIILSRIGLWLVSNMIDSSFHYNLSGSLFVKEELSILLLTVLIGFFASLIPAIQAYRTDISTTLSSK